MLSSPDVQELADAAPDAIAVADGGRIVLANAVLDRLFGYAPGELLGRGIEVLIPERYRHRHAALRDEFTRERRTRGMGSGLDLVGVRKDGTEFPVDVSLRTIELSGKPYVSVAIRDAQQSRGVRRELERIGAELGAAIERKNRFLALMSHEFRTPLNTVLGYCGALLMQLPGPLTPAQRIELEGIQASGRDLQSLLDAALAVAEGSAST